MRNTYYQIYRNSILTLARSCVIKYHDTAIMINKGLRADGYIEAEENPARWKYYLHLNGEYHETDQIITVRSIDTLETIPFTKDSLKTHRATRREYLPGGRFHQRILLDHPNQTNLIRGILNPVPPEVSINADDGTLLSYGKQLIEANEYTLVEALQRWLYGYHARWYNLQYNLLDDLYLPLYLGQLYLHLVPTIERLRLARIHTREAHSFHVREYLASNGGLDRYLPYLTKSQTLWLYRNIRYVNHRVGQQTTFATLINEILTVRNMPLQGYHLTHDYTAMEEGKSLYASVYMTKDPINVDYIQSGIPQESVRNILDREGPLARDNRLLAHNADLEIQARTSRGIQSNSNTKVLESEIVDRTNSSVRSLTNVLVHEWTHLATSRRYSGYITFNHPVSGELLTVSVKDALIIALYAVLKLDNQEIGNIPHLYAYEVLRAPLPTREDLYQLIDTQYVPTGMVEAIQDRVTPLGTYVTPDAFYSACRTMHDEYLRLWELYSFQEHYKTRGYAEQLVQAHYMDIKCPLVESPVSFEAWITEKGYDLLNLTTLDYGVIFTECVNRSTGANLKDERSLAEIQRMLLKLMGELSSYGVHYIQNINLNDFVFIRDPAIRVGDIGTVTHPWLTAPLERISVLSMDVKSAHTYVIPDERLDPPHQVTTQRRARVCIGADVGVRVGVRNLGTVKLSTSDVTATLRDNPLFKE